MNNKLDPVMYSVDRNPIIIVAPTESSFICLLRAIITVYLSAHDTRSYSRHAMQNSLGEQLPNDSERHSTAHIMDAVRLIAYGRCIAPLTRHFKWWVII